MTLKPLPLATGRSRGPLRAGVAAALWFTLGGGFAFAQANNVEESGVERRPAPDAVNDKAFDCGALRDLIAAASQKFTAQRGPATRDEETIASYSTATPLFGSCQIIEKKKIGEVNFSCQADKLELADLKATLDSCLGEGAGALASNENPNTPFLRYDVNLSGARARVMAMKTFGKTTLAIFNPK